MLKRILRKLLQLPEYFACFNRRFLLPDRPYMLMISHSDYKKTVAGTERALQAQVDDFLSKGIDTVNIFPLFPADFYQLQPNFYAVRINNTLVSSGTFAKIFSFFPDAAKRIREVHIHHLMNWRRHDISLLIDSLTQKNTDCLCYLHDFFFFSPSAYSVYSGKVKKEADIFNVDSDFTFKDGVGAEKRLLWKNYFHKILCLSKVIITPSDFLKKLTAKHFQIEEGKIKAVPLVNLVPKESFLRGSGGRLKIAFLGYMIEVKGSSLWKDLIGNKDLQSVYDFYHFGGEADSNKLVKHVPYSFIKEGVNAAVSKLRENKIDLVLLWSLVPESYSYTLYESLAAGCYVLTGWRSGNIAYTLREMGAGSGRVFLSSKEFFDYLSNSDKVLEDVQKKVRLYELKPEIFDGGL